MTKKPLDRINEAYKGEIGADFMEKTRNRINWIVNQVKGKKVLDIGCSQGIIPIILGREGKRVDALDIAEELIDYAKTELENEHVSVKEHVHFKVSNFMTEDRLEPEYETILLTEVLEHISDTDSFLEKVYHYLSSEGHLIVTVPFGINDYFDHKRTYYFLDLFDQVSPYFSIEKMDFIGKWTGIVCRKNTEIDRFKKDDSFNRGHIKKLEEAFLDVERELLNRILSFQMKIVEKNEYINRLKTNNQISEKAYEEQTKQKQIEISNIKQENEEKLIKLEEEHSRSLQKNEEQMLQKQIEINNIKQENEEKLIKLEEEHSRSLQKNEEQILQQQTEIGNLNQRIEKLTDIEKKYLEEIEKGREENQKLLQEIREQNIEFNSLFEQKNNQLLNSLQKEEEALHSILREKEETNKLQLKTNDLERKYRALKNSRLGAVTLKYWGLRKKIPKLRLWRR